MLERKDISCRVCGKAVNGNNNLVNFHDKCQERLRQGKVTTLPRKAYIIK